MAFHKLSSSAVLTGDIVNSTKLNHKQQEALLNQLTEVLDRFLTNQVYEFFRGDSFQVFLQDPAEALRLALVCRCVAIGIGSHEEESVTPISDIRISIGIGKIDAPVKKLGLAKGEAFFISGRQFEFLKEKGQRLAINCADPIANIGFQVMGDYLDSIYEKMTVKQAQVILELLQGVTQQQLAVTQAKSKSTISELASAGGWGEIEKLLQHYKNLVSLIL